MYGELKSIITMTSQNNEKAAEELFRIAKMLAEKNNFYAILYIKEIIKMDVDKKIKEKAYEEGIAYCKKFGFDSTSKTLEDMYFVLRLFGD